MSFGAAILTLGLCVSPDFPLWNAALERIQVRFLDPHSMTVSWSNVHRGSTTGETPFRINFIVGRTYQLRFKGPKNEFALTATMDLSLPNLKAKEFVSSNAVIIGIDGDELAQLAAGKHLLKAYYLPKEGGTPQYVTSSTDSKAEPICDASQRGSVLIVLRIKSSK